ncbi:MAG TPA: 2-oxo acid dehydrogenase subunit E2 [Firmicutes bacterium]|nr:2-oxo acid dehydrogenase subunit E2 [Bacillota bacterium]
MVEILMPKLGLTMTEGTITAWLKPEGSAVQKGEPLLEVATDKITNKVEAPGDGRLKILAPAGSTVPVAGRIGYLLAAGESLPAEGTGTAAPAAEQAAAPVVPAVLGAAPAAEGGQGTVKASPAAKRLAREKGVDLSQVTGSGPEGRITEKDVEAYLAGKAQGLPSPAAVPPAVGPTAVPEGTPAAQVAVRATPTALKLAQELGVDLAKLRAERRLTKEDVLAATLVTTEPAEQRAPLAGMRRVIARRMKESWSIAPHVTINMEVDMSQAKRIRAELNAECTPEEKVSFNDLIIKAAARALTEFPQINATITDTEIIYHNQVHMGVAVALADGLVVPVVCNADKKDIRTVAREVKDLAERARGGQLKPDEATGSTFTVTNLGMYGVDHFTPIINQPESAILGVGCIKERPVVVNGSIEVRPVMTLSLSFDHRLIDGSVAAEFLGRVRELLENPYGLRPELA